MTEVLHRAKKKAALSPCRFKICAVAFDSKGNVIAYKNNTPRFRRKGGGNHAEMRLMRQYKQNIKLILILRVGLGGEMRPIHPCKTCSEKAEELGIQIRSI